MKFYTADLHIDHKNIIKLCKRPFSDIHEMRETFIEVWNNKVSRGDDVYHLGDFAFGVTYATKFIERLNGTIHFISGNHDEEAMGKLAQMKDNGCPQLKNSLFHGAYKEVRDEGHKVILFHYPIYEWNGFYRKDQAIHLHGHTHQNIGRSFKKNAFDVGCDGWNFEPVSLKEILSGR